MQEPLLLTVERCSARSRAERSEYNLQTKFTIFLNGHFKIFSLSRSRDISILTINHVSLKNSRSNRQKKAFLLCVSAYYNKFNKPWKNRVQLMTSQGIKMAAQKFPQEVPKSRLWKPVESVWIDWFQFCLR